MGTDSYDGLHECRRCLLYELADRAAYNSVKSWLAAMPQSEKAGEEIYRLRLERCRECDFLLSGMCRKCGCYVEIRAAGRESDCPGGFWSV